ncbi:hypothetical protein [Empedobacter brevis]|uniref:hypothetical protein n=1 Tax=Empedobacter brevis TaxID=247 RepID=UPI0028978C38|nr:hypothetical protein [Empedobacter brevis]
MKKIYFIALVFTLLYHSRTYSQLGINTNTPQSTLHVNGSMQVTNEIYLGGTAELRGEPGTAGQVLKSGGSGQPAYWDDLLGPSLTGTVMVINGKYTVAQEITVLMSNDFFSPGRPGATIATVIGNLDHVIIDNNQVYSANNTTNSFQVIEDGVYMVTMNMQLTVTNSNSLPVIGIWDDQANRWVARVNDAFNAPNNDLQTYTLITSISMLSGRNYSFRTVNTDDFTIKALSSGTTGSGPISQVSIRRLK